MKKRYWIVLVAVVLGLAGGLVWGIHTVATKPTAACSTQPATIDGGDYFFDDTTSVGSIVAGVQCLLEVRFPTRILAETETATCSSDVDSRVLKGNEYLVGQCKEGFILTKPALNSIWAHAITTIWIQLGESIAQRRFANTPGQLCAAGYIARSQPTFDIVDALPDLQAIQKGNLIWTQQGFSLRERDRSIGECATAGTF